MKHPVLLFFVLLLIGLSIIIFFLPPPLSDESPSNTVRLEISHPSFGSWLSARKPSILTPARGAVFTITSSGYAPSPYQTDSSPCITAAGTKVRPGTVASNFLPLGTILEINGDIYIVEDRMNSRYYYAIDIFFPSTSDALQFGRKKLDIKILGYGKPGQPLIRDNLATEPIPIAEIEPETPLAESIIDNVSAWQAWAGSLLGARSLDVNRYDIDCFSE